MTAAVDARQHYLSILEYGSEKYKGGVEEIEMASVKQDRMLDTCVKPWSAWSGFGRLGGRNSGDAHGGAAFSDHQLLISAAGRVESRDSPRT